MRNLIIETFNTKTNLLIDSACIPVSLLNSFSGLFQGKLSEHFKENGDQLDLIVESVKNEDFSGTVLKLDEGEKQVVISIA